MESFLEGKLYKTYNGQNPQFENDKAPEVDNLPAEFFKKDTRITAGILQPLFRRIWETEVVAKDWKESIIVKIPEKGDLRLCGKWPSAKFLMALF